MERTPETARHLAEVLRAERAHIVDDWLHEVQAIAHARDLDQVDVRDHVPQLLDRLAQRAEHAAEPRPLGAESALLSDDHALERLSQGFDLNEVVAEYALLRRCILERLRAAGAGLDAEESALLHAVMDEAIASAATAYAQARDRLYQGLDRISEAALGSDDVDAFLPRLLEVLGQLLPRVDEVTVLLVEGDRLVVRAARGSGQEAATGFQLAVGEGFAGLVAQRRVPFELSEPGRSAVVLSGPLREAGLRVLYGVPLLHAGGLVGVAHIGSRRTRAFSPDEKLFFRALTSRATAFLSHARMAERERQARADAYEAHALADALFAASPLGVAVLDPQGRCVRVNEALARMQGHRVEEYPGQLLTEMAPPGVDALVEHVITQVIRSGEPLLDLEAQVESPPGSGRVVHRLYSCYPVCAEGGKLRALGLVVSDITRRKEEAARARRWEEIFRHLTTGVAVVDRARRYVDVNPAFARMHGLQSVDEVRGRRAEELLVPADRPAALVRLSGDGPDENVVEARRLRADGSTFPGLMHTVVVRDEQGRMLYQIGDLIDLTARKQAEAERESLLAQAQAARRDAEEASQRLAFLSRASEMLASSLDLEVTLGRLAHLACEELADYCILDVRAPGGPESRVRRVALAAHDPARQALLDELVRFAPVPGSGSPAADVLQWGQAQLVERVDPGWIARLSLDARHQALITRLAPRSVLLVPLRLGERVHGVVQLARTSAERPYGRDDLALAEDLARRAAVALENAQLYQQAQQAVQARQTVLAVVSHDLRNPLAGVLVGAERLERRPGAGPDGERVRAAAESIRRGAERMQRLVSDLLDGASIDSGQLSLRLARAEAGALLAEAREMMLPVARAAGVSLALVPPAGLLPVHCDRGRILQVLGNLLGNAVKFSPPGGCVRLGAGREDGQVRLWVADEGPGIAPAQQPLVFERFWRAQESAHRGTGLGLFIARGIVEHHGGRIGLESRPGQGATFFFTLPLLAGEED